MKKLFKEKRKGIAERKTEVKRKAEVPYKAVGLGILLWLGVTWLFFGSGVVRTPELHEGQKTKSTVVAAVDFECENLSETQYNRNQAAGAVPPVFKLSTAPAEAAAQRMTTILDRVTDYAAASTNQRPVALDVLDDLLLGSGAGSMELIGAFPTNEIPEAQTLITKGVYATMGTGILSDDYRVTLFNDSTDRLLTIIKNPDLQPQTVSQKDVYFPREAVRAITSEIRNKKQKEILNRLLHMVVVDNLSFDQVATDAARDEAAEAVEPVIERYPAGSTLIRAGEIATKQTTLLLRHHAEQRNADQDVLEQIFEILGNGLLLLAGLLSAAVFLRVTQPKLIRQPDKILLMVVLSLLTLGVARLLALLSLQYSLFHYTLVTYLTPFALAVLLGGILLGGPAAITIGFWCSFATAVLLGQSFSVFALGMIITITATSTARNVHRRSSLFRAGLYICAVKGIYVIVTALLSPPLSALFSQRLFIALLAAFFSGMIATVLTMLLLPIFEKFFKITTDIRLLELSDMGHPLLQKMAIQAPGTYHHSLMVATLAQNAAEAIGANSLLIRVCAYYHDIGKMAKPEFFTENIQHKENPHDELSPHMSALVISSHVKEGIALAKRHKLPQPILDAIEQHHGNGLISYFYHKAKSAAKEGAGASMAEVINDSDFRYGGAPAVTPEMAILSLADASEAAARSIEKPTPQKISNMMDDIFAMKIRDGQMDYANLTMAEINVVKQSFIFSLSNMLHGRIPYPKDDDNNAAKSTDKTSAQPKQAPKAG